MPHIPGHVTFESQLTEWEKKRLKFAGAVESSQNVIQSLEGTVPTIKLEDKPSLLGKVAGLPLLALPFSIQRNFAPSKSFERLQQVDDLKAAHQDLIRNIFFAELYGTVPALIAAGALSSPDEALEFLSIPDDMQTEELQNIRREISQLLSAKDISAVPEPSTSDMPELTPEGLEFPPLVAPTQLRDRPITIHQLSTRALLKSLTTPKVPETAFTPEEYDAYLESLGWSEEDIDNKFLIQRDQLIAEAQNRKSMQDAYKGEVAKMPDFTLVDALKMSIINPPLIALEGLGFYYERVSMPAAGWLYGGGWKIDIPFTELAISPAQIGEIPIAPFGLPIAGVRVLPRDQETGIADITRAYEDFRNQNPDASEREAYVYAWKKWEAPGPPVIDFILKYMLMEGVVDPLSLVGWGFITRGLRTLGPVGRTLAAGNMAAAHVLELPFDAIKYITKSVIPKTVTLRAAALSRESQSIVKRYIELTTGKPLSFMQPKDANKAATEALAHLERNPRAEDDIALAAREILAHPPVSRREATGWMSRLRSAGADPITDDLLTPQVLLDLDTTFERVFSKEMGVDEAAPYLLSHFGVAEVTEDVAVLAGRFLSDRSNAIFSRALDFTLEKTSNAVMRSFARKTFRIFESQSASEALVAAERSGRFGALFYNLDKQYIQPWAGWLDRMVVRTAAESYLTFGMYGPMNVLEDVLRSALGGVKPGRVTVEQYDILVAGLLGDPELRRAGFSETFGPLRETGDAARSNWMLTLSLLPVSVPTFAVTSLLKRPVTPTKFAQTTFKTLVEAPGAISAELRRNFVAGRYAQLLSEHGGGAHKALLEVVPKNLPSELASAPKWVKRNLARDMRAAVTTGKLTSDNAALITALKNKYTRDKILRAEVNDVIMKYPDISPTGRSMVLDGFDEKVLLESPDSIQSYMKQVMDAEVDDFLRSPERATAQFDLLTERLTALEVTNPQDMAELIVSLHRMSSTYGMLPNQIMARATVKSRGLPINDRRLQFDAEFDRLYNFMDKAGASVDRVVERVRLESSTPGEIAARAAVPFSDRLQRILTTTFDLPDELLALQSKYISTNRRGLLDELGEMWSGDLELQTVLHNELRAEFGNSIKVYRGFRSGEGVGQWKGDYINVTTDRAAAVRFGGEDVVEMDISVGAVVGFGSVDESELLIRAVDFRKTQVAAGGMSVGQQEATQRYLDLVTAARKVTADAKAQDIAFRSSFFADATQKDLRDPAFWNSLKVSLRFTAESVVLTLLIGLGVALTLARSFPGKRFIRSLVILPWAVSRYGAGIMFKYLWRGYTGLPTALSFLLGFNTRIDLFGQKTVIEALAVGNAWNLAPLVAFFLLANIETIPERLYDMAEVDKLGPFGRFYYVTLPYLRYTLFVFTAIVSVLSLKVFDYIFTQTGGGPGTASATLTYQIYKESFINLNLGYGAALSFYLLALILAVTFALYFVWGRREV
ncbi:hypothetical protein LCGC14_1039820 [marine sediment metagenome]|uniref:ABC transmembrane type-1 domain-containing protein n=1 Tax=marine sediment metagenome TaxID=412755 RepID=A0A0F9MWJ6_9ZZZZ